jgi:hypothetical protein
LKRIVEEAVAVVSRLPRPGLWFAVDEIEVCGRPPERLRIWCTLHFLDDFAAANPDVTWACLTRAGAANGWRRSVNSFGHR